VLSLEKLSDLQIVQKDNESKDEKIHYDAYSGESRDPLTTHIHQYRHFLFRGRKTYIHAVV
jgi:hypothetical protein